MKNKRLPISIRAGAGSLAPASVRVRPGGRASRILIPTGPRMPPDRENESGSEDRRDPAHWRAGRAETARRRAERPRRIADPVARIARRVADVAPRVPRADRALDPGGSRAFGAVARRRPAPLRRGRVGARATRRAEAGEDRG